MAGVLPESPLSLRSCWEACHVRPGCKGPRSRSGRHQGRI